VKARHVRGINYIAQVVISENGSNDPELSYFLFNGHGDTVQTVTPTGEIRNQYDYDIFGNPTLTVETAPCSIRYAGEYLDNETGLYYLRARYYDPYTGRFISEDSYWGEDTNPLSLNLYTYAYNNPVRFIDPTGHNAEQIDGLIRKIDIMKEMWWAAENANITQAQRKEIQESAHREADRLRAELAKLEKGNEMVEQLVKQSGDDAGTWEGYKLSVTLGKATKNPDEDYSSTLKKQVEDFTVAASFGKNSSGINSSDVEDSIKTSIELLSDMILADFQPQKTTSTIGQQFTMSSPERLLLESNNAAKILAMSGITLASTEKSLEDTFRDAGNKAIDVVSNVLLGVFSSIVSNVDLTLAEVERVIFGLFDPDFGQYFYNKVVEAGDDVITKLEESISDEVAYYVGRLVTDVALIEVGIYGIMGGITTIGSGATKIGAGIAGTFETFGGSLILVASGAVTTALGVVEVGASAALAVNAGKSGKQDARKLINAIKNNANSGGNSDRTFNIKKQESEIWNNLDNVKGSDRKTSGQGKNKQYYEWDFTHNDIEVYDSKGNHLGSMDPVTGEMYKPPVKGRKIKLN
jgi:RHS repeat-associated protein